jgi:hypothetical protein
MTPLPSVFKLRKKKDCPAPVALTSKKTTYVLEDFRIMISNPKTTGNHYMLLTPKTHAELMTLAGKKVRITIEEIKEEQK